MGLLAPSSSTDFWWRKKDIFPNLWLFVLFAELGLNRAMGRVLADWVLQSVRMVNIGIVNLLGQNLYFVLWSSRPSIIDSVDPNSARQVVVKFVLALCFCYKERWFVLKSEDKNSTGWYLFKVHHFWLVFRIFEWNLIGLRWSKIR